MKGLYWLKDSITAIEVEEADSLAGNISGLTVEFFSTPEPISPACTELVHMYPEVNPVSDVLMWGGPRQLPRTDNKGCTAYK